MNKTIAVAIGLMLTLSAHAQSLAEALEQAWARQPQASAAMARDAEAQARSAVAASLTPAPASLSLATLNDQLNANRGKQEWEIELSLPLWLPGQQAARLAEAASAQSELRARRHALRWQIAGQLRDAWWALAAARNAHLLAERRVGTADTLVADVMRRYRVGELARLDANLAQAEQVAAQAELADAQTALWQAEQNYRDLTGVSAPTALPAETQLATHEATDEHPLLASALANVQLARARLQVAAQRRRDSPSLALRLTQGRDDYAQAYARALGVKFTLPLSSDARVRADNAAAQAELAQADAELALAQAKLVLDSERARRELANAQRQLALAQQRVALSADNLALAEKSFALGESDLPGLLRVRAAAIDAQAILSRQQYGVAAAQSRNNQILGVLP